jgi:DNA-binding response OmpR family regulator
MELMQLGPDLWLDLEAASIINEAGEEPLTAHEYSLLQKLVHSMGAGRGYLPARVLAADIVSEGSFDPEHAIEDTISNVRRKLGEIPYAPKILVGRRGIGYRLRPLVVEEPKPKAS